MKFIMILTFIGLAASLALAKNITFYVKVDANRSECQIDDSTQLGIIPDKCPAIFKADPWLKSVPRKYLQYQSNETYFPFISMSLESYGVKDGSEVEIIHGRRIFLNA